MTWKVDLESLTPTQCRALTKHCSEFADMQTAANNELILRLSEIVRDAPEDIADRLQQTLNQWSVVLNSASDASEAEVRRIVGEDDFSTSTIQ